MTVGYKTGGRQKGTGNKLTTDIKNMIVEALDKAGGVKYLVKQANKNPAAFLGLVGKVMPLMVHGDKNNPIIPGTIEIILKNAVTNT